MAVLNRRRRSDGSVHIVGDIPAEHYFSDNFIQEGLTSGELSVSAGVVTLHTQNRGDIRYRLMGFEQEDGTPNRQSWHVALVED